MLDDHLINIKSSEDTIRDWWKKKRLNYNVIIGSFGIVVMIVEAVILKQMLFEFLQFLPFIILFGILANLCYYIGQILELYIYQSYTEMHNKTIGPKIFWIGIIFSISIIIWIQYIVFLKGTSTPF